MKEEMCLGLNGRFWTYCCLVHGLVQRLLYPAWLGAKRTCQGTVVVWAQLACHSASSELSVSCLSCSSCVWETSFGFQLWGPFACCASACSLFDVSMHSPFLPPSPSVHLCLCVQKLSSIQSWKDYKSATFLRTFCMLFGLEWWVLRHRQGRLFASDWSLDRKHWIPSSPPGKPWLVEGTAATSKNEFCIIVIHSRSS